MMYTTKGMIAICWLMLGLLLAPRIAQAQSINPLAHTLQATVQVVVFDFDRNSAISGGSGSIITPEGLVLTNYHVVDESVEKYNGRVVIYMPADRRATTFHTVQGRVIVYNPREDLAVVQITHTGTGEKLQNVTFPFIARGTSTELTEGDQVYAIGYPDTARGRRLTTQGIISGFLNDGELDWILSDVDISNGNSGGPLLTTDHRLIGIPTRGETGVESAEVLGYSRPIEAAEPLIEEAINIIEGVESANATSKIFCTADFTSNNGIWPLGYEESDSTEREDRIAGGALHSTVRFKRDVYSWINAPDCNVENFRLRVDTQLYRSADDDNAIGIHFRQQENAAGEANYYQVLYYRDGSYEVTLRYAGEWKPLQKRMASPFIRFDRGETNQLEILVVGAKFTVFANEKPLITIQDDTLAGSGEIGLGLLGNADEMVYATFDNFVVSDHKPEGVLFDDEFVDNHNKWQLSRIKNADVDCEDKIVNGRLEHHLTAKTKVNVCYSSAPELLAQDFWLQIDTIWLQRYVEGSWLEIAFRHDEATGQQYTLRLSQDGYYLLEKYDQGEWHTLQEWTKSAAIKRGRGQINTVNLWVRGPYITLMVNDVELITVEDDQLIRVGQINPGIGGDTGVSTAIAFDNLIVRETPPPAE